MARERVGRGVDGGRRASGCSGSYGCSGCHGAQRDGPGAAARRRLRPPGAARRPARFVTADERYIRDSILLPQSQVVAGYEPVMPTFQGHISEDELLKIIAYIKSIGKKERVER